MFPESRIKMYAHGKISPRLVRRISAAEGYLDLNMPERAMRELEAITEPGPYEPTVEYMKGEALIAQRRFSEAIGPLKRAVQLIPPPHNKEAWKSLGECYRLRGDEELADVIEMFADQEAPGDVPNILQILNITLMMEQAVEDHDEEFDWDLDGSDE
jgi:tetratricopeptide (TPR) repeat protein